MYTAMAGALAYAYPDGAIYSPTPLVSGARGDIDFDCRFDAGRAAGSRLKTTQVR